AFQPRSMSTPATFSPRCFFLGRSRTWPMLASTLKPEPRYLLMVLAFDGDSTMTRSMPSLLAGAAAGDLRVRRAVVAAEATERDEAGFLRVFEVAAGAAAEVFLRVGTGRSFSNPVAVVRGWADSLQSPFWRTTLLTHNIPVRRVSRSAG